MMDIFKVFTILLMLNIINLYSQTPDKEECFNQLLDKYGKMNSVHFEFSSPDIKNFTGSITAVRGNKYVIKSKDRDVYCNGKTIWNKIHSEGKILISYYDDSYSSPMSVEKFFFNFLEQYSPSEISESTSSLGTKSYVLQLTPKSEKTYDIDDIRIWIDPKNYIIRSVKLKIAGKIQTLIIENLELNKKFPDKTFDYEPSGKEQVIDFR